MSVFKHLHPEREETSIKLVPRPQAEGNLIFPFFCLDNGVYLIFTS